MPRKNKSENSEKEELQSPSETSDDSEKSESKEEKLQKISQDDFEKKVIELAKEGATSEKIGEKLRSQGIHPNNYNKKISKILKEKKLYVNPDIKNISEKLEKIKQHYEKNKQDKRAMREKDRIFAQLRKTKKYFGVPLR